MNCKEKGSFYTPQKIASWVVERVLTQSSISNKGEGIRILEPSCGDGVFLKCISQFAKDKRVIVDAVEYDKGAFEHTKEHFKEFNIVNADFLFWENENTYDFVLGNPPYIAKKKLPQHQSDQCRAIHVASGLRDKEVANIWTSFVLKAASMLNEFGSMGFILPNELLQVNYAREICDFLCDKFPRLEVISFRKLAFENIEQDTVILIAHKDARLGSGLYFSEVDNSEALESKNLFFEKQDHLSKNSKWSSYILTRDDMDFVERIAGKYKKISDVCNSVTGIVTAANDFFILPADDVNKYNLHKYVKPIIQKGLFVNGSAEITKQDFEQLELEGRPCYLLDLTNIPVSEFSRDLMRYLEAGENEKINERYKCQIRKRWFDVPLVWKSEAFFFKRSHHYPKLLVNRANVHVTDSAYRIKMQEGYNVQTLTMSFYNSLTLLCGELYGRYYGGGVLEITPNEFKKLPIPAVDKQHRSYEEFILEFERKNSIEEFVAENDNHILRRVSGITSEDIARIQNLYSKMKSRRLKGEPKNGN